MTLKEKAMEMNTLSKLFNNRSKIAVKELYGQTISINEIDILHDQKRDKDFIIAVCNEYPDNFFYGGTILSNMVIGLVNKYYGGSIDDFNADAKAENLVIKMTEKQSKTKNSEGFYSTYTNVELV
jgi:hypothetical protein